jgi:hypothetical protein
MDYRQFLGSKETRVLPYFGGTRVDDEARRLRVTGEIEPGWWRFQLEGRRATAIEPAGPVDLSGRPAMRGHFAEGWLFASGRELDRFALPADPEPEPLAPCTGRRWFGGELLFEAADFEDEPEMAARSALDAGAGLTGVKGVAPSLRAAFGFALLARVGRAQRVRVSPREAAGHVHAVADGGSEAAAAILERIEEERREWARLLEEERRYGHIRDIAARARAVRRDRGSSAERADAALEAAGARMLRARNLGDHQLEVAFTFMGEQFVSVVDSRTLHVYDAGICLQGHDEELTLDSLPSAIREAVAVDILHITRW